MDPRPAVADGSDYGSDPHPADEETPPRLMNRLPRHLLLVLIAGVTVYAAGAVARTPSTRPATRPKSSATQPATRPATRSSVPPATAPVPKSDHPAKPGAPSHGKPQAEQPPPPVVSRLALETADAVAAGQPLADFQRRAESNLLEVWTSKQFAPEKLIDPVVVRQFVRFFARVREPTAGQRQAMAWALRQPRLGPTLMLAISDSEAPDRVLSLLTALYLAHGDKLEQFPDLTAALCVVWDAPQIREKPPEEATEAQIQAATDAWAVKLFGYFTTQQKRLHFDPADVPWQLAVYTVDITVGPSDMAWAVDRYGRRGGDLGDVYFDVPYDTAAFYGGDAKKIDSRAYTLPNLVQFGGVCVDQAYFACQVQRIMGIPAVVSTGQGGGGDVGHAWVGYMGQRGRQVLWDFGTGRYAAQLYWTGQVQDPQTRSAISESEVQILVELQKTSPQQRLASLAIIRSLDIAPEAQRAGALMTAIDLSAGNREAWLAIAAMGRDGKLNTAQADQVAEVVKTFAAKSYADFALRIYKEMIAGRSNVEQIDRLEWLADLFKNRTDLAAEIRIAQGRLLSSLKRDDDALKAYGEVLQNHLYAGPIVLDAMAETDKILRARKDYRRLAGVYEFVFNRMPKPQLSAFAATTPYVTLGQRYADLLESQGNSTGAAAVRSRLTMYLSAVGSAAQR